MADLEVVGAMTEKTLRVLAILILGALCAGCVVAALRFQSVAGACLALWLAFALVVETWPSDTWPRRKP